MVQGGGVPKSDIDRSDNTFWPWVLGLMLLAAVVWVVAEATGPSAPPEPVAASAAVPVTGASGTSLQAWVRDSGEAQERTGDGESYTVAGLRRIAAALEALVEDSDSALHERARALAAATAGIDTATAVPERVNSARAAFLEAVDIIEVHTAAVADPVTTRLVAEARAAAVTLEEEVPLEDQRHRVFTFFDHVSEALRLAEGGPAR
jgi:hypothetical protein